MRRRVRPPGSGLELTLLEWGGPGPLVLLHHANGFCAGTWGVVAEALATGHRVVALDARGHGDSDQPQPPGPYAWECFVEDLVGVAQRVSSEQADGGVRVGVGHSFGGTALLGAAARHPDLFQCLLLVDPVIPAPEPSRERTRRARLLGASARRRRRDWPSRSEALASWSQRPFFASWDRRVLELYAAEGLRERAAGGVELKCPPEVEAAIFEQSGSFDAFAAARQVAPPATILWASRGDFPRAVYERLAAGMPDARVVDVECGHLVPMERPDLVISAIREAADRS